jgi:hypothetical protein
MRNVGDGAKVVSPSQNATAITNGTNPGRRTLMEEPTVSVRRYKRVPMAVPAFYDLPLPANGKENRLLQGIVRDFSDAGICLFTNAPLQRGERITVFCRDIWGDGKSGTVLWCNTLDLKLFRVGVYLQ